MCAILECNNVETVTNAENKYDDAVPELAMSDQDMSLIFDELVETVTNVENDSDGAVPELAMDESSLVVTLTNQESQRNNSIVARVVARHNMLLGRLLRECPEAVELVLPCLREDEQLMKKFQ